MQLNDPKGQDLRNIPTPRADPQLALVAREMSGSPWRGQDSPIVLSFDGVDWDPVVLVFEQQD
jgi:hypothetical protein